MGLGVQVHPVSGHRLGHAFDHVGEALAGKPPLA